MTYRLITTIVLLVLVLIFALQNSSMVEIQLFFWQTELPRSLLIFMMLVVGVIIGWFTRGFITLSRKLK